MQPKNQQQIEQQQIKRQLIQSIPPHPFQTNNTFLN